MSLVVGSMEILVTVELNVGLCFVSGGCEQYRFDDIANDYKTVLIRPVFQ